MVLCDMYPTLLFDVYNPRLFIPSTLVGEKAQDDGWLMGASELHLQLFPTMNDGPIKIASLPNRTCYSIKVEPMIYDSQPVSQHVHVNL